MLTIEEIEIIIKAFIVQCTVLLANVNRWQHQSLSQADYDRLYHAQVWPLTQSISQVLKKLSKMQPLTTNIAFNTAIQILNQLQNAADFRVLPPHTKPLHQR